MAQVVYTSIDQIEGLAGAKWTIGDQASYEATMRMAGKSFGISLIGRRDNWGLVSVCYAGDRDGQWTRITTFEVALAKYFSGMLSLAPAGDTLAPFFDEIEPEDVRNIVRQLVAIDCGATAPHEEKENAVRRIEAKLRMLGIPCGDWTFLPMVGAL